VALVASGCSFVDSEDEETASSETPTGTDDGSDTGTTDTGDTGDTGGTGGTDTGDTGGTDTGTTDAATPAADIAVLVDGAAVTSAGIDFGGLSFSAEAATKTVTIQNNGDADLSGTATLSATGSNAGEFALGGVQSCTISVAAGASVTVTVSFDPSSTSSYGNGVSRTETVTVASNDPDTASLSFPITGVGGEPEIGLSYYDPDTLADDAIVNGSTQIAFGTIKASASQVTRTLTIANTGYSVLSGTLTLSSGGSNSGEFTVNDAQTCTFSVEAGAEEEIELGYDPYYSSTYEWGSSRKETVTIASNDEDESSVAFDVYSSLSS